MSLSDTTCTITGQPGIHDDEWGGGCACVSPILGIFCDGTVKDPDLWRGYRGFGPIPEQPPGKRTLAQAIDAAA